MTLNRVLISIAGVAATSLFTISAHGQSTPSATPQPSPVSPPHPVRVSPPFPDIAPVPQEHPNPDDPSYSALYDAVNNMSGSTANLVVDRQLDEILAVEAEKYPTFAKVLRDHSLNAEFHSRMRPVVLAHLAHFRAQHRKALLTLFATYLPPEDAEYLTKFYRSPLGRRWLDAEAHHGTMENTVRSAAGREKQPHAVAFAEDAHKSQQDANAAFFQTLSKADRISLTRTIRSPAFVRMTRMMPQSTALAAQLAQQPWSDEDMQSAQMVLKGIRAEAEAQSQQ